MNLAARASTCVGNRNPPLAPKANYLGSLAATSLFVRKRGCSSLCLYVKELFARQLAYKFIIVHFPALFIDHTLDLDLYSYLDLNSDSESS